MRTLLVDALLAAGVVVVVASAVGAVLARDVRVRLHLLTPVTSLGAPLVAAALAVADGVSWATASLALTAVLLVASAPVTTTAVARLQSPPDPARAARDAAGGGR